MFAPFLLLSALIWYTCIQFSYNLGEKRKFTDIGTMYENDHFISTRYNWPHQHQISLGPYYSMLSFSSHFFFQLIMRKLFHYSLFSQFHYHAPFWEIYNVCLTSLMTYFFSLFFSIIQYACELALHELDFYFIFH